MPALRSWDGAEYDRLSSPMERLGREVLDRAALRGDETVLDAGCGSGRLIEALLERLPAGRVIAVDASPSMIEAARARVGDRADLRVADLTALDLGEHVDLVFSTATFHWIADHERLFAALRGALRDGGRLVAQCGGAGNVATVDAAARAVAGDDPFAAHLAGWPGPWNFATPQDTERRLRAAGFAEARCALVARPVTPEDPRAYLEEIVLGAHLERLPERLRAPFVDAVSERLGPAPAIDYVRLNIDAVAA
jgi:trans-aconitate 2-methyltransferase